MSNGKCGLFPKYLLQNSAVSFIMIADQESAKSRKKQKAGGTMDIKDICNAGGDILDAVADAVNRNDYSGLSENVTNTVNRVVRQVREDASKGTYGNPTHQYAKTTYTRKGQADYERMRRKENSKYSSIYKGQAAWTGKKQESAVEYEKKNLPATVAKYPTGRILGPLQLAWGILATSGFGITTLIMLIVIFVQGGAAPIVFSVIFGLLTALSVTDIVRGSRKISLVNRFYHYARLIGERGYIAIEELALQTGQHRDEVVRDLRKMMKKHMFPQGRIDNSQTTFMLTQDVYQQYLQAEQEQQAREEAAKQAREAQEAEQARQAREEAKDSQTREKARHYNEQTKKILKDGNAYIRMVHECNEKIRGEEMSYKLSRLESIMRRIFEQVEKVPQSADDLHKFMDYYLPTTTKLLQAYIDLDRQEIAGENISATKKEIEDTLDTINIAFERLLDGLFEDTAWDISSDISVMKTMMAQEGLTGEKDFKL